MTFTVETKDGKTLIEVRRMAPGTRTEGHASLKVNVAKALPQTMRANVMELTDVRTDPAHRGQGEATNLMMRTCMEADIARKFLLVQVEPSDDSPLDFTGLSNFYMRFGFVPIQTTPAMLMVRPCTARIKYGHA